MRLFAALYPDDAAFDSLERALNTVTGRGDPGTGGPPVLRWIPRELWHITLAFYGEVPPGAVDELAETLAEVAMQYPPLRLHLRGAGIFNKRVLWVGVGGDDGALRGLSAAAAQAGADAGLRLDRRPRQRAHLTVARIRPDTKGAAGSRSGNRGRGGAGRGRSARSDAVELPAAALAVYEGPWWQARELALVESDLTGTRPVYRVVSSAKLGERPLG